MYSIKKAAQISGVSVKTLHHYDKVGLLVPKKLENSYRMYTDSDLERLQVILFYKYLGFSLKKIAELLSQSEKGLLVHLLEQLNYLQAERLRLDTLISTLQQTIQHQKGEIEMTTEEKFAGFTYQDHTSYREQAVQAYGADVMNESDARQAGKEAVVTTAFNDVFFALAEHLQAGLPADAPESQVQADKLLETIRTYSFDCSLEVFRQIGQGYVYNPEFQKNIDQFGAGTAQYAADVIAVYVDSHL